MDHDAEWAYSSHCLGFSDGILIDIEPVPLWSAGDIIAEYESNEVAANEIFQSKTILIVGYVSEVGESLLDGLYIELDGDDYSLDSVRCYFAELYRWRLAELRKGQKVVIEGIGAGKDIFSIDFVSCRIFWKRD